MLEQLFGSQTRVRLLQIFLSNPEEKYFVRELTRNLNSQINAIRRELENLEDLGAVKVVEETGEHKSQKKKFYQSNIDFILYHELKSIFQKAQFLLEKKFAKAVMKIGKVHFLALTGTFVGKKDVPIDIIAVGTMSKKKFAKLIKDFQKNLKRELNYTLLDREEFNYRRSVADRFLYNILDSDKIVLIDEIFNPAEEK
jgi:predicted transcriptional regulator